MLVITIPFVIIHSTAGQNNPYSPPSDCQLTVQDGLTLALLAVFNTDWVVLITPVSMHNVISDGSAKAIPYFTCP